MVWTYYITDRKSCPIPLIDNIRQAINAGIDFIQIREKDLPARVLYELASQALGLASGSRARILVNDRLDVALAARLDGIHLGQQSLPPREVRYEYSDPSFLLGVSTHSLKEIDLLHGVAINFVTFGPVFHTPSKAAYGDPVGLSSLQETVRSTKIPVLALGGINRQNFRACLSHGAAGIAAIRLFQDPTDPFKEIIREIQNTSRL